MFYYFHRPKLENLYIYFFFPLTYYFLLQPSCSYIYHSLFTVCTEIMDMGFTVFHFGDWPCVLE